MNITLTATGTQNQLRRPYQPIDLENLAGANASKDTFQASDSNPEETQLYRPMSDFGYMKSKPAPDTPKEQTRLGRTLHAGAVGGLLAGMTVSLGAALVDFGRNAAPRMIVQSNPGDIYLGLGMVAAGAVVGAAVGYLAEPNGLGGHQSNIS